MFDRHTSDSLNPVFFKIVHQMTSSPIMPLLYVIQALLVFGFFLGAAHLHGDRDLAADLRRDLPADRVVRAFFPLDIRPFGMS